MSRPYKLELVQNINGNSNGLFGRSVAINKYENVLAVGEVSNNNRGAVKIYSLNGNTWSIRGNPIVGNYTGDATGYNVTLNDDGNIVAFGETGVDLPLGATPTYTNNGRVRIFYWNSGINNWSQYGTDLFGILGNNNQFGSSVSISNDGNTLACGYPYYNNNTGYVHIYKYNSGNWNIIGNFAGIGENTLTGYSTAISSDGNTVAISSPNYYNNTGFTKIYTYAGGSSWNQKGTNSSNTYSSSLFINGANTYNLVNNSTASTVYNFSQGTIECWVKIDPLATTTSYTGCILGNQNRNVTLWVSYRTSILITGYLFVYDYINTMTYATKYKINDGKWHHIALSYTTSATNNATIYVDGIIAPVASAMAPTSINPTNPLNVYSNTFTLPTTQNNGFCIGSAGSLGYTVVPLKIFNVRVWNQPQTESSIASNMNKIFTTGTGLMGVYCINQTSGTSLINQVNPSDTTTQSPFTGTSYVYIVDDPTGIFGLNANTYSGSSISLANNGNTLAIGEPGPTNSNSGNVRVFNWNSSTNWGLIGNAINSGNNFGSSVSLNGDVTYLSAGAYSSNISGANSGYVKLYNYSSNNWNQVGSTVNGTTNQSLGYSVALGSQTLAVGAPSINGNGSVSIYKIVPNNDWIIRTGTITGVRLRGCVYGNGLYVAVNDNNTGLSTRVITSPDTITWTPRSINIAGIWTSIAYGNNTYVVTGTNNLAMYSSDTTNWTSVTLAQSNWPKVIFAKNLFVAVSPNGYTMYSADNGQTWTTNVLTNAWYGLTYSSDKDLFVATSVNGTGNRVATSTDGMVWTKRTSAADKQWGSVAYGNGVFTALTSGSTSTYVNCMYSYNGYTWLQSNTPYDNNWSEISYGRGLFVATGYISGSALRSDGNLSITSTDGINWVPKATTDNQWYNNTYGNGWFMATINITNGVNAVRVLSVPPVTATLTIPNYTKTYNDPSFSILPNISTNNTEGPTYSYTSNSPLIANIVNGIVTIGNVGTANVTINQSETINYTSVTANVTITVNKIIPSLTFPSSFTRNFQDLSFSILPNISTNNPEGPTYSYSSNFPLIANIVDGIVTIGNAGIANISLTQSETTNYLAVTANTSITVNKIPSSLTFPSSFTRNFQDASFSILPNITTNNPEAPSYSYSSNFPLIANIVNGTVTVGNAGIANIVITQSATTNYASISANTTITVNKIPSSLTFPASFTRNFQDPSFSILPNITTNNPEGPTYSYNSGSPLIANIVNGTVTVGNAGIANIVITQSATTNYLVATANTTITVNKSLPTLSISNFTKTYNDPSFSILPNITTNNPEGPTYSYNSGSPLIANIVNGTVTIGNAGIANIVITQSATTNYLVATANTSITVNKSLPTLTFPSSFTRNFQDPSFSILPNISTNNPEGPTYSYNSNFPLIANIVDGTVTVGNAGIADIVITQSATTNYSSISANTTITINKIPSSLTFPSSFTRTHNDPSFSILPNISTNNPEGPSYSYSSDSPLITNIVDGIVTIGNAGIANIVLTQSETTNYTDISATSTFTVNKSTASLTFPSTFTTTYNDPSFSILSNISTNNPEGPTYSYSSDYPLITNIVDGIVTIGNAGIANIVLTQSETTNYTDISATTTFTVNKSTANLTFPSTFTRTHNDPSFSILSDISTNNTDGPTYSYSSDSPLITNIVDGIVTIGNAGIANIVLIQSETANYTDISATTTFTVNKSTPNLTFPSTFTKTYNDPSFSILPNISTNNPEGPTYSYSSDSPLITNIVDGIVTIGNAGTASIVLTQSETTNYTDISAVTTFTVNKSTASLTFPSSFTRTHNDPSFSILANISTNNTDGPTYSYQSDYPLIANIVDGIVTIGNAGTASIVLTQSETTNYTDISAITTFTVNKSSASLTFPASFTRTHNDPSFSILSNIITNNTEGPTYTYNSDSPLITNIVDGIVTIGNAGIANIVITQSATTNYMDISSITTFTVNKSSASLTFPASFTTTYNDPSFSILPNIITNNTEEPTYSYNSDYPLITNIVDGIVTIGNAGIANIVLTQSETTNYTDISATTTFTVNKSTADLTFPSTFTTTYNDPSFSILPNITTNNNEEPTYTYSSDAPLIANIIDGTVIIGNTGIANIVLTQSATTNYTDISATTTITVNKSTATLTFPATFATTYNDASFSILGNIITNNTEEPTYSYNSDNPLIANMVDGTVIIGNAGIANIILLQSETTNYTDISASTTITVNKSNAELTVPNTFTKRYNAPSFSILPNISTTNTDPYSSRIVTYQSDNSTVANIVAGIVTIGNIGNAHIQLYQPETTNYFAVTANTTIEVDRALSTINIPPNYLVNYKNKTPFHLNATSNNTETPIIYTSGDTSIASVDASGVVTIGNIIGNTQIQLYQSETTNYTEVTAHTIIDVGDVIYEKQLSVEWNGKLFVLTIRNDTMATSDYLYSYDGFNWSSATDLSNSEFLIHKNPYNIKWTGSDYAMIGDLTTNAGNTILKSKTGIHYSAINTNAISPMFDLEANLEFPHTITFPRNMTLALGGLSSDSVKIAYSIDEGITWIPTTNSSAVFNTTANNAVWNGKLWVAVGSANNTIATSTNGMDWVGRGSYIFTTQGFGIEWSNEQAQFIGAGSGTNALAYSYDGVYWMGLGSTMLSVAYDVQWNGSIWVATGSAVANNKSIAYSYDGRTWMNPTQTNLFDIAGKKVSWNGEFWIVVGSSTLNNSYYNIGISNDGIIWNMIFHSSFTDTSITDLYSNEVLTLIPTISNLIYATKFNEL